MGLGNVVAKVEAKVDMKKFFADKKKKNDEEVAKDKAKVE